MSRAWRFRERQDLFGKLCILAAEVMSCAHLLARHPGGGERWTYAVFFAFLVHALYRHRAQVRELRPCRQSAVVAAYPVGNADFERGAGIQPEQAHGLDPGLQVCREPVDDEGQHIGAEGVTNEQDALLVPARKIMANDAA